MYLFALSNIESIQKQEYSCLNTKEKVENKFRGISSKAFDDSTSDRQIRIHVGETRSEKASI